MRKPKTGATSTKKTIPKRPMLEVEDADSLKAFLKKSRAAWEDSHPFRRKKRGRPSFLYKVIEAIEQAAKEGKIGKKPSQGKIIRLVQEQLGQSDPSEDTIRPYAKIWHLANIQNADDISDDAWIWLGKGQGLYCDLYTELCPTNYHIKK